MTNSELYRAALGRWNAGDVAGYLDFYSDDVVFGGVTPEPMDKAETVAFHEQFATAFPGSTVEVVDLIEQDDRLGARLILHLQHEGEFMGVSPTGRQAQLAITTLLRVAGGKCVERWSTADMYGLLAQLGAIGVAA
jgi:predicted ester cyclase